MKKEISLTFKILAVCIASILITGILYIVLFPISMNFNQKQVGEFVGRTGIIIAGMTPLFTYLVYVLYKPVRLVLNKIKNDETIENKLYQKAITSVHRIPNQLFLVGAAAYLLAFVLNLTTDISSHNLKSFDYYVCRFLSATAWGIMNGLLLSRFVAYYLMEAKLRMKILDLSDKNRRKGLTHSVFYRMALPSFFLFFCFFTFTGVFSYNSIKFNQVQYSANSRIVIDAYMNQTITSNTAASIREKIDAYNAQNVDSVFISGLIIFMSTWILILLLYLVILYEIQMQIQNIEKQIDTLSQGVMDLRQRLSIVSFDDLGRLTAGINLILEHLKTTFAQVKLSIQKVYEASNSTREMVTDTQGKIQDMSTLLIDVDDRYQTQYRTVQSTVGRFGELMKTIDTSIRQIADQTQAVEKTSASIRNTIDSLNRMSELSKESEDYSRKLAATIEQGKSEIGNMLEATNQISASSDNVSEIIRIIADIADQSNILAMNAAIQASHAGETGKGFAVVAREMRNLALSTSQATGNIDGLIRDMKHKNARGLQVSDNLKQIFEELTKGMQNTGQTIGKIADFSREQSEQAGKNLEQIDSLLELTVSLKQNTESQREANQEMGNSIGSLESSFQSLKEFNDQLSGRIRYIVSSYERLNENYTQSYRTIDELEQEISLYKLE